ncbi:MAG: hypothetical protein JWM91_4443 [Rhodospirillales bacterium]|nr:hypothetical protein [Rhodospirillales bacterium]
MPPYALRQPVPRQTKTAGSFVVILAFFAIILIFFVVQIVQTFETIHEVEVFKAKGTKIDGLATNLHTVDYNRRGGRDTSFYVDYSYQPTAPKIAGSRSVTYRRTAQIADRDYRKLHVNQTISVIYDPNLPSESRLAFEQSWITLDDPENMPGKSSYLVFGFPAACIVVMLFWFVIRHLKERKLLTWGEVAAATIIDKQESHGRWGPSVDVIYRFIDADGETIVGKSKGISNIKPEENIPGTFAQILDNPTAVYDRENSKNNFLYRTSTVSIVE